MKVRASVTIKDKGFRNLMELSKVLRASGAAVKVGVLDDPEAVIPDGTEKREGGLTNAEIAAVHEFGSADGRIPERSFVRSTFDTNREKYMVGFKRMLGMIVEGRMSVDKMFNILGLQASTDIKKRVTAGDPIPPPNAPSTEARKRRKGAWNGKHGATGIIRPLIDTGRMIASVTWAIVTDRRR